MIQFKPWMALSFVVIFAFSCRNKPGSGGGMIDEKPLLNPDYTELTIPYNIAPMNFSISGDADSYFVELNGTNGTSLSVSSKNGQVVFPSGKWKKLLSDNKNESIRYLIYEKKNGKWSQYRVFENRISDAPVDKYLYYRMLYPGYESWSEISIIQRSLEDFSEKTVVQNNVIGQNCVNCHSFNRNNGEDFMIHIRGSLGGTYFLKNGSLAKYNLKTEEMENGAVYPRWHPSGRYVAFSSNKVIQQFHSMAEKKIEVSDLNSSLVLYDVEKNEIMDIPVGEKGKNMDTYPEWSPDGLTLYFCRADSISGTWDYRKVKYNLYRVSFDPQKRSFGQPELILDAAGTGKSVSFPRVSPDGNFLIYTCHDYGCFPIWHKEADLFSYNLKDSVVQSLALNSPFTDSYHSWSANGKWMVFSSKRDDGLNTRPYIAYINEAGQSNKPFILPQRDPEDYLHLIKSFNVPEFSNADVSFSPGAVKKAAASDAIPATWVDKK